MTVIARYGRSDESPIRISDTSVSTRHASLDFVDGSWFIEDLKSTNGTFVNGTKISRCHVVNGDVVHLGSFKARFENGKLIVPSVVVSSIRDESNQELISSTNTRLKRRIILGVCASLVAPTVVLFVISQFSSESATTTDASKATVFIEVSNSQDEKCWIGSGFLVGDGSLVATNAHVATPSSDASYAEKDCTRIRIGYTTDSQVAPSTFREAEILEISEADDLALLQVLNPLKGMNGLKLAAGDTKIGEALTVFGYPLVGGETITVSNGVVSGFDSSDGDNFIKISAIINGGNSGGPVVGNDGKVLAVASAARRAGIECSETGDCYTDGQELSLARPISLIAQWLNQRSG